MVIQYYLNLKLEFWDKVAVWLPLASKCSWTKHFNTGGQVVEECEKVYGTLYSLNINADDQVILAEDENAEYYMLQQFDYEYKTWYLQIK